MGKLTKDQEAQRRLARAQEIADAMKRGEHNENSTPMNNPRAYPARRIVKDVRDMRRVLDPDSE